MKDSGERREFETGAVRDRAVGKGLPALISAPMIKAYLITYRNSNLYTDALDSLYDILLSGEWMTALPVFNDLVNTNGPLKGTNFVNAIRRLSVQLEKGALKYSKRNWEKGMPLEEYCNSAIRHILSCIDGDEDEDHYAAALFNVMGLWHTGYMISIAKLPKELNNLPGGDGYATTK